MDVVGCLTFLIWLIKMFVFDVLQTPTGCIQICSGCTETTCTPLAIGLC